MSWIIVIFVVFSAFTVLPVLFMGAPFMPSYRKKSNIDFISLFNLLRSLGVKKIIDLGSGDGRVVIDFAKAGFESYGVEINPILVWWCNRKIRKIKLENSKIIWCNMWKTDLSSFDAVFIFHFETSNKFLSKKFEKELKTDAIVISTGFPVVGDRLELIKKESPFLVYKKSGNENSFPLR
ncbi:MAG: class I SAM-dependent methyltransferase [Patescibacteria group bacterium]